MESGLPFLSMHDILPFTTMLLLARIATALLALAALLPAQEYRATLLGQIRDSSGALIPNALVTVSNINTGVRVTAATGTSGYTIPYLVPGIYSLTVEANGFKTHTRGPIALQVNDRVRIDVALEVGASSEHINVTAEAPLLEVSTASRGQVIGGEKINGLPLNGHNPFTLMGVAEGVQNTGSLTFFRPFDNGSINDFSINGGRSSTNEYQIDGVSDIVMGGRSNSRSDLGYVPPAEATQEFKVQTNTYDAQYGRTGGGIVSLSVKPGTNKFHGAAYEFLRRTALEANTFSNNASARPRAPHYVDQWGGELDGPIKIPKLYDGHNRTFFMFSYEHYREAQPQPVIGSVPTAEQRAGDFTQTLTTAGKPYTIYDPYTVGLNPAFDATKAVSVTNPQYIRQAFAGNKIPATRFNPVATRILQDIPLPNQLGNPVTLVNNWYAGDVSTLNYFDNMIARVDHNINSNWRLFTRWNHSFRDGGIKNPYNWDTAARQQTHNQRTNDGAILDATAVINARTILTLRAGFNRYFTGSIATPQDITALGFPASLTTQLQAKDKYPQIKFENYIQTSNDDADLIASDTYSLQASLSKMVGRHSLKMGGEYRILHYANYGLAGVSGIYSFTRGATASNPQVTDTTSGNAIASFLLGTMSSGNVNLNATPYVGWRYPALFLQDDWQVTSRLSLNLGLRWDLERTPVERYNRQNRGFDFTAASPIAAAGLSLKGGLLFAGQQGQPRGAFVIDKNNWQPRAGMAYKLLANRPLVFRAGVGRYFLPTTEFGGTLGYSQTTLVQASSDNFVPFRTLSNPFPNGIIQPAGSALGLATGVGDGISFSDPNRHLPYVWQYSAGFQYEIYAGLLLEVSYSGSQTSRLQVSKEMNALTADQLALGTPYLSAAVANPFFGVLAQNTTLGSTSTVSRRRLLAPYPQFTSMTESNQSLGDSWYNSLQVRFQQRMKFGLSYLVSYTRSKTMEAAAYLNPQDAQLSRELTAFDTPQRTVVSGLYEVPIGPGKQWLNRGLISHLVGGWQAGWIATFQSGNPISLPDYYINGDPRLNSGQTPSHWFNTSPAIWVQRPTDTLRTAKLYSPNIRRDSQPQLDLNVTRNFRLAESYRLQLRASAFNATNTAIFDYPNTTPSSPLFGTVAITQRNLPRSIELGLRLVF
jgi:hypothetical protein